MNNKHQQFVKEIAKEFDIDERVAYVIISSLFIFTAKVIRDVDDPRPIRHRYWGVFSLLKGKEKT